MVEGATVGRGYLADGHNALGLFIPAPEWAVGKDSLEAPRRFYRCGDLVRYNSDGSFNFIGRKDITVKVRGQRLELAKVEECLKQHNKS